MAGPNIRLLRGFVAVAAEGSFTRAAARLKITQPTLSSQIQRLEEEVGFALLERTTRSVALTSEGTQLIVQAENLVATYEGLQARIRQMRDETKRELRLGTAFFTTGINTRNAFIDAFTVAHPNVNLSVINAPQSDIVRAVKTGRLDCGIVLGVASHAYENTARLHPTTGDFPFDMMCAKLASRRIRLLVPAESELGSRNELRPADLAGHKIAMIDPEQAPRTLAPLSDMLVSAGAIPVYCSESRHAPAVERFAAVRRIACVSLGWFGGETPVALGSIPMVYRKIVGFDSSTVLAIIADREVHRPLKKTFLDFSQSLPMADEA